MAKYAERRYVVRREEADPGRLYDAVKSRDLTSLLQLYAEGADLAKPLTVPDGQVQITHCNMEFHAPAVCPIRLGVRVVIAHCDKSKFKDPHRRGRPPGLS